MRITGNTADFIRKLAENCLERGDALKRKRLYPGPMGKKQQDDMLSTMALDYFVGAASLSKVLGVEALTAHLQHVIMTEIDLHGYAAVEKLARRSLVAIAKPSTTNDNKEQ